MPIGTKDLVNVKEECDICFWLLEAHLSCPSGNVEKERLYLPLNCIFKNLEENE